MRRAAALGCALALLVAGCGGDDETGTVAKTTTSRTSTATAVAPGPPVRDAPVADGRRVFERSGCLACHQLVVKGNPGPGNNLTGIGSRRSPAEIRRSIVDAPNPMPSYRELGTATGSTTSSRTSPRCATARPSATRPVRTAATAAERPGPSGRG